MITFAEAEKIVYSVARVLPCERVALADACHRILGEAVCAGRDVPACALSAVDGFACHARDCDAPLTVVETIAAGVAPSQQVGPGQCARIMTGAVAPSGADTVVMFEDAKVVDGVVTARKKSTRSNIRDCGVDAREGDILLREGARIGPAQLAVLAAEGHEPVVVRRRPVVGIIATGSEVVEPSQTPQPWQIRNGNAAQLMGAVQACGAQAVYRGLAGDRAGQIEQLLGELLQCCDVVLLSGGVSVGDFDLVPEVLKKAGIQVRFHGVAVKPGKPVLMGTGPGGVVVFGMPGNPGATLVLFEILVKPFLYRMMGHLFCHTRVPLALAEPLERRSGGRLEWIPVAIDKDGLVRRVPCHGSAHIHAFCAAQGYVVMDIGVLQIDTGATVTVVLV